jgi:hypothetical protein
MNATACQPLKVVRNRGTGGCRKRLKGTKRQMAKRNQAMIEMLRGRAGRCGAAIGGVGSGATSVGMATLGAIVREGGGGVAE